MFFKKKKRMIDVRELQKRGVVQIPKSDTTIPKNQDEFIEVNNNSTISQTPTTERRQPNADSRITDLDNKIYKLENRIELLEKKLNINQPNNNVGVMGW